jgi:hypothetical protein
VNLVETEAAPVTAQTYDAVNDFSLNGNPNSQWSYGELSGLNGTFTPYPCASTNYNFSGEEEWSDVMPPLARSAVHKNTTNVDQSYCTNLQPPDLLCLDSDNGSADVRWTALVAGTYDVSGRFERIDWTSSNPVSVYVVWSNATGQNLRTFCVNPAEITFQAPDWFSFSNSNSIPNALVLSQGDTLDFCQFSTGSYIGGGLAVTITSVPEPTSLIMLLGGIGAIGLFAWRRRRQAA